jgi:Putative zinc-finger
MPESQGCHEVRELLPELAMGIASGEVRARALGHLAECQSCRLELEGAAATVDELAVLAPEHEPAPGFDSRVLAAIRPSPPHHRIRNALLAAAVVVLVAAGAFGLAWRQNADDRQVADQYRDTLEVANGSYFLATEIVAGGSQVGTMFAYQGSPSWLFMTVSSGPSGEYQVRAITDDGRTLDLGSCWVRDGVGSWGTSVDTPIRNIAQVELVSDGDPVMVARLP